MSNSNFQSLNLSDSFLFPAALEDPVTCRLVLECIIDEKIDELEIRVEYTKKYNSEFKCIRLDVYAKDTVTEISYNLEMQNRNEHNLPLRSRYYQAQIDVGNLKPGMEYVELKPVYVIFICNFDPFDQELYRYTFSMQCEETKLALNDGAKRIFLSTKGKNREAVSQILIDFLGYLNDSTDEYVQEKNSENIKELHQRIKELKQNRDVEARYMHYLYVDSIINQKEEELKRKDAELQEKDAELQEKDAELQEKDAELQEKDAELQEKDAELQEKDAELQEKDAELQEKDEKLQEIVRSMVLESVEELGKLSSVTRERINSETDIDILKSIHKLAVQSDSIEYFEDRIINL